MMKPAFWVILFGCLLNFSPADEYLDGSRILADMVNNTPSAYLTGPVGILTVSGSDLVDLNQQRLWNNFDRAMERKRVGNITRLEYEKNIKDKGLSAPISRSYQQYSNLATKLGYKGWVGIFIVDDSPDSDPNLSIIGQVVRSRDNLIAISGCYPWNREFYQPTALDRVCYQAQERYKKADEFLRIKGYHKIMLAPTKMADGSFAKPVYNAKIRAALSRTLLEEIGMGDVDGESLQLDTTNLAGRYGIDAIIYPQIEQQVTGTNPVTTTLNMTLSLVDAKNGKEAFSSTSNVKADYYTPQEFRKRTNAVIARNNWIGGTFVLTGVPMLIISSHINRYPDFYDANYNRVVSGGWNVDSPLVYIAAAMELTGFAFLLGAGYLMLS